MAYEEYPARFEVGGKIVDASGEEVKETKKAAAKTEKKTDTKEDDQKES